MVKYRLSCIVCHEDLEAAGSGSLELPPLGALIFTATGNFGSTVFDPIPHDDSRESIKVVICDECIKIRALEPYNHVEHVTTEIPYPTYVRRPFTEEDWS